MSKIIGNEPANPVQGADGRFFDTANKMGYVEWVKQCHPSIGLTIRQHFAAMAMQGLIYAPDNFSATRIVIAADAVKMADALIAELNKDV